VIDVLIKSLLAPKAKVTRDTVIIGALAWLVVQVGGIDKRLAVIEAVTQRAASGQGTNLVAAIRQPGS
jgi:hypothetical protein